MAIGEMTIGERIKMLRTERGIAAEDLGDMIGKSRATIFRYENGTISDIPISVIPAIADALGIEVSELIPWAKTTKGQAETDLTKQMIELFNKLDPNQQAYILGQTQALVNTK